MLTTVTTATAAVAMASTPSLALIAVLALIVFLIQKEIVSGIAQDRARRLSRALNIVLAPLGVVFAAAVVLKIIETLY